MSNAAIKSTSHNMVSYHLGRRLSHKGQRFTVRYYGPVDDTVGDWYGVQWDDETRGKHNGTYKGKEYFTCKSSSLLHSFRANYHFIILKTTNLSPSHIYL